MPCPYEEIPVVQGRNRQGRPESSEPELSSRQTKSEMDDGHYRIQSL